MARDDKPQVKGKLAAQEQTRGFFGFFRMYRFTIHDNPYIWNDNPTKYNKWRNAFLEECDVLGRHAA